MKESQLLSVLSLLMRFDNLTSILSSVPNIICEIRPAAKSKCHGNIAANQIRCPHPQVHARAICPSTRHLRIAKCWKICAIPELHRRNNPDAAAEVVRGDGLAAFLCHPNVQYLRLQPDNSFNNSMASHTTRPMYTLWCFPSSQTLKT